MSSLLVSACGVLVLSGCASSAPVPGVSSAVISPSGAATESPVGTSSTSAPVSPDAAATVDPQPPTTTDLEAEAADAARMLTAMVERLQGQAASALPGEELPAASDLFEWEESLASAGVVVEFFDSPLGSTSFPGLTFAFYELSRAGESVCVMRLGDVEPALVAVPPDVYNAHATTYIAALGQCVDFGAVPSLSDSRP